MGQEVAGMKLILRIMLVIVLLALQAEALAAKVQGITNQQQRYEGAYRPGL